MRIVRAFAGVLGLVNGSEQATYPLASPLAAARQATRTSAWVTWASKRVRRARASESSQSVKLPGVGYLLTVSAARQK